MSIIQSLKNHIKVFWLGLLLATIVGIVCARHLGVALEDAQAVAFPLILLAIWRMPQQNSRRIPGFAILIAAMCWIGGVWHIRSYALGAEPVGYVARFNMDVNGLFARSLYTRYNQIAHALKAPNVGLIFNKLDSDKEARAWLLEHPEAQFVLYGDAAWYRLVFATKLLSAPSSPNFKHSLEDVQLSVKEVVPIESDYGTFAALSLPEAITVSSKPPEHIRHILVWVGEALSLSHTDIAARVALDNAADVYGAGLYGSWPSPSPFALVYFLLGVQDLLNAVEDEELATLVCAENLYRKAAGFADAKYHPEIAAAIFNNAAIAKLLRAESEEDTKKARQWLEKAMGMTNEEGAPVRGAKAALHNLQVASIVF